MQEGSLFGWVWVLAKIFHSRVSSSSSTLIVDDVVDLSILLSPKVDTQGIVELNALVTRGKDGRRSDDVMISKEGVNTDSVTLMVLDIRSDSISGVSVCSKIDINIVRKFRLVHYSKSILSIPLSEILEGVLNFKAVSFDIVSVNNNSMVNWVL